jgi:hypothetical protein
MWETDIHVLPCRIWGSHSGDYENLYLLLPVSLWLLAWLILRTEKWRRHILPKRQWTFNGPHSVIPQKMELLMYCHFLYVNEPLFRRAQYKACFLLVWPTVWPWKLRKYVHPKRRWTSTWLHDITSQKQYSSWAHLWEPEIQHVEYLFRS